MKKDLLHKHYQLAFFLNTSLYFYLESIAVGRSLIVLNLSSVDFIKPVLFFLKHSFYCQSKILTDITAVDHPQISNRFELTYFLISVRFNIRIAVRVRCNPKTHVPSVFSIFSSANWLEREVWDMFGIYFSNHTDLRRILTDYGFKGHPLRKDFSLNGYYEVRYDELFKTVMSEPVEFSQEFRLFDFRSPWESAETFLIK